MEVHVQKLTVEKLLLNILPAKVARESQEKELAIYYTGPLVAGVVGRKKFAYEIWGDTVNIASHIESSGESGKINISDAGKKLVYLLIPG